MEKKGILTARLPAEAYTDLGGMQICRIVTGLWQLSGTHGYRPLIGPVIKDLRNCIENGFLTFDLADIYGESETLVGKFVETLPDKDLLTKIQFFTKWVPRPGPMDTVVRLHSILFSFRKAASGLGFFVALWG